MKSLALRLAAIAVGLLVLLAVVSGYVVVRSAGLYYDELAQRLNADIAMYVESASPLIREGRVDAGRLADLSRQAMIVNPLAHVYLLDPQGRVFGDSSESVDLEPIREFLSGNRHRPIYGEVPARPGTRRIFSAAPIREDGALSGYVYVLLGGDRSESLAASIASSRILSMALFTLALVLLVGVFSALVLTHVLSRPLASLHNRVIELAARLRPGLSGATLSRGHDLASVGAAVEMLAASAQARVDLLSSTDRERRILFESIGHDLRSPLTAARGYVESLLGTLDVRNSGRLQAPLDIVHRHLNRLSRLVDQIFLLARLESPTLSALIEPLKLQEIVSDIGAKFLGNCQQMPSRLHLAIDRQAPSVCGNCELIETVVENLLDNALRHTAGNSPVILAVRNRDSDVEVSIVDNGPGISLEHIPCGGPSPLSGLNDRKGLGLAIVTRALTCLGSRLTVRSRPGEGTVMSFCLPHVREDSVINSDAA